MVFTVGHSTLAESAFTALLAEAAIERLWRMRSYPSSRWTWFRREHMRERLSAERVKYVRAPDARSRHHEAGAHERVGDAQV